jgi:hypothetical protein
MATLHTVGGEVGGAGKTMFCMVLLEAFLKYEIPFHFRDADRTTPNVGWAYDSTHYPKNGTFIAKLSVTGKKKKATGDVDPQEVIDNWKPVIFSEDLDDFSQADRLIELAVEKDVIVNLPAQVSSSFDKWLVAGDFLSIQEELGINFIYWWVAKAEQRSIDLLLSNIKRFPGLLHVLVCNQLRGTGEKWDSILTEDLEEFLKKSGVKTINMLELQLAPDERGILDRENPRFSDLTATDDKRLCVASKARCRKFVRESIENIIETGYLNGGAVQAVIDQTPDTLASAEATT